MSGRLIYKDPTFSTGAYIAPIPELQPYGEAAETIVQVYRERVPRKGDRPSAQDAKRTLRDIASKPSFDKLRFCDDQIQNAVLLHALALFRPKVASDGSLDRLSLQELGTCAREALAQLDASADQGGRPEKRAILVAMTKDLLAATRLLPTSHEAHELVRIALHALHEADGDDTVQNLLKAAGKVS